MSAGQHALMALPADVQARFERLIARVRRGHVGGCPHLETNPVAYLCVMHPAIVRCRQCAATHVDGHTFGDEYCCDECGRRLSQPGSNEHHRVLATPITVDTTISTGRGRRAAVGVVVVYGYGRCHVCCGGDR